MSRNSYSFSSSSSFRLYSMVLLILLTGSPSFAHMNLRLPIPRTHQDNPYTTASTVDYDIMAPLNGADRPFACSGIKPWPSIMTVKAGDSIPVQLEGSAPHDGGHCEFSISYDNQNFVSLKTVLRECMRAEGLTYAVPLPASMPPGKAVFSWTWVNAEGNREFYQNCADITVEGGTPGGVLRGPKIVLANLPGFPTIPEMTPGADEMQRLYQNRPLVEIAPLPGRLTSEIPASPVPLNRDVASPEFNPSKYIATGIPTDPQTSPEAATNITRVANTTSMAQGGSRTSQRGRPRSSRRGAADTEDSEDSSMDSACNSSRGSSQSRRSGSSQEGRDGTTSSKCDESTMRRRKRRPDANEDEN